MTKLMEYLAGAFRTAIRNARQNPKTTIAGATSLATGITLLQTQPLTADIMAAGIAAVLVGIGGLLADDNTTKPNDTPTTNNENSQSHIENGRI